MSATFLKLPKYFSWQFHVIIAILWKNVSDAETDWQFNDGSTAGVESICQ